jgi:hypothetical protein
MNAGHRSGPADGTYLWQYLLGDNEKGVITARLVRNFGNYSGRKEIESIVVDDRLDYVYYSDELVGVRTYYADTAKGNTELAHFITTCLRKYLGILCSREINKALFFALSAKREYLTDLLRFSLSYL